MPRSVTEQIGIMESSLLDLIMKKIFGVDFRRLELYIVFLKECCTVLSPREKYCLIFGKQKNYKSIEIDFSNQEKRKKARIREITCQNKCEQEIKGYKRSAQVQAAGLRKKKSTLEKWKILC